MGRNTKNITPAKISHPFSRKAKALIKHNKRLATRDKSKFSNYLKHSAFFDKIFWFRNNVDSDVPKYTPEMVSHVICRYMNRYNDELNTIKAANRYKERKHASREDQIRHILEDEKQQYEGGGIEFPDILNEENFTVFKNWNGEERFLPNIRMTRYKKCELERK